MSTLRHGSLGALTGAAIGTGLGAYRARKRAKELNLDRKSLEYKKFRNKYIAAHAVGGGAAGALVGTGISKGAKAYKKLMTPTTYEVPTMNKGDILKVPGYGGMAEHYGVYVGDGHVIEYNSPEMDARKTSVRKVPISQFNNEGKKKISVEAPNGKFTPDQIKSRAEEALKRNDNGDYHLTKNNCEHFARDIANGSRESTQVNNMKGKLFSEPSGAQLATGLGVHNLIHNGYNARKYLSRDLGGLSHFDRHQTHYLTGGGSLIGGAIGYAHSKRKAKRDAESKGLVKGSQEYKDYIRSQSRKGLMKGALIGAGAGVASSAGLDVASGALKAKYAKVHHGVDLGNNYYRIGKSLRGINSSDRMSQIKRNYRELGDYAKANLGAD